MENFSEVENTFSMKIYGEIFLNFYKKKKKKKETDTDMKTITQMRARLRLSLKSVEGARPTINFPKGSKLTMVGISNEWK